MEKVLIFYGPKREFEKEIPDSDYKNLTEIAMTLDADTKIIQLKTDDSPIEEKKKIYVRDFVIESGEYASVKEHVIQNFINFISKFEVDNLYIHNPPLQISRQILKVFKQTKVKTYQYNTFKFKHLKIIDKTFSDKIVGQDSVKERLLTTLFPLTRKKSDKPVVILFYGNTGLGKTETAKYLSQILSEELFRKQFSMFQNNQAFTYLFGGAHWENSFAKELLDRESNVILLDEFDKAHSAFHSAFYQLFDEGIYEDQNYSLKVEQAIIICTSNYKSESEIKKNLGEAIYSRFDAIIEFSPLSLNAKKKIIDMQYKKQLKELSSEEKEVMKEHRIYQLILEKAANFSNAREIEKIIIEVISKILIRRELNKNNL